MLADLAHELRTPITTLTAYHDGLHDGVVTLGPDSQTLRDALSNIRLAFVQIKGTVS